MSERTFDALTEVYEGMIDWPKRLAAETPLLRRVFERVGVLRVADVACGTGRHARMFHEWGLEVEGSDISPAMIERARGAYGEPAGLRWAVRGFEQPAGPAGSFDAVVCLGNSLALAADAATAGEALRQMLRATRAGGAVVVQVLNLWKLPDGPMVWQKVMRQTLAAGPSLILKGVHRCGDRGYVELVVVAEDGTVRQTHSNVFLGLEADALATAAREAGAADVEILGGHPNQPYNRATSPDIILVAYKG